MVFNLKKLRRLSEKKLIKALANKLCKNRSGYSTITLFGMGEFAFLTLAYSLASTGSAAAAVTRLFVEFSVLLTAAFHQRSLSPVNCCIQTATSFFWHCPHVFWTILRLTKNLI
jgi:hypothetical protein